MEKQKKIKLAAIAAAVVLVIAVVVIAVSTTLGSSAEETLLKYYRGKYEETGGGVAAVSECIAPSVRQSYYDELTSGGTNFAIMATWRADATTLVGQYVEVAIDEVSAESGSAAMLGNIRSEYPEAEAYQTVTFLLTLTGNEGTQAFNGEAPMIRTGGDWYLLGSGITLNAVDGE